MKIEAGKWYIARCGKKMKCSWNNHGEAVLYPVIGANMGYRVNGNTGKHPCFPNYDIIRAAKVQD